MTATTSHANALYTHLFPPASASATLTTPTPQATPNLGFTAPGTSFGGITSPRAQHTHNALQAQQIQPSLAQLEVKKHLAWSTATGYLGRLVQGSGGRKTRDVDEALNYLLVGEGRIDASGRGFDLVEWFAHQVTTGLGHVVDELAKKVWAQAVPIEKAWTALEETVEVLGKNMGRYRGLFEEGILGSVASNEKRKVEERVMRSLHMAVVHGLPLQRVFKTLSFLLYATGSELYGFNREPASGKRMEGHAILHGRLLNLLRALPEVGLAGSRAQRAFAQAIDKLIDAFVGSEHVKVDWYTRKSVMPKVRAWVREGLAPFVEEVLGCLNVSQSGERLVGEDDVKRWQEMCVSRLGKLRVESAFDFVVEWDGSLGAILDMKEYVTTPSARAHLTTAFTSQLSRRLLHAGATTTHILDVYIYVIRAFNELDPKGVLLERVARPIRRYLRDRDDTARIIVASLLADVSEPSKNSASTEISLEIAKEMANPVAVNGPEVDLDMDFSNMDWTPDPIDAGPEYKKSKSEDVIAYLLSLYDREEFIGELKNILGEHLLRTWGSDLEKETMLLELFKLRLGDDKLQACEVMLHDIQASHHITREIQRMPHYKRLLLTNSAPNTPSTRSRRRAAAAANAPQLSTQILSSFFWPSLREEEFALPDPVVKIQDEYAKGFEAVKDMRKLRWLPALGKADVVLEFEDRKVETECAPWQASVIYAFNSSDSEDAVSLTAEELEEKLEMDEALVKNALAFWVSQSVLRPPSQGSSAYSVIERLSDLQSSSSSASAPAPPVEAPVAPAVKSHQDVLLEKEPLYATFISGILTNQGNMPVMRIHMMLRMALAGGFTFGQDDVRFLLERMERAGKVSRGAGAGGEVWGVVKK